MLHLAVAFALVGCSGYTFEGFECTDKKINPSENSHQSLYGFHVTTVANCVFSNVNDDGDGGAIFSEFSCTLWITCSSFTQCSSGGFGGAVSIDLTLEFKILLSSFCECSATAMGNAFSFNTIEHKLAEIDTLGVYDCGRDVDPTSWDGIHLHQWAPATAPANINFTGCHATYACMSNRYNKARDEVASSVMVCQYLNVVGNSGVFGFYRAATHLGWTMRYCNFIGNPLIVLGAPSYAQSGGSSSAGMFVESCIFADNEVNLGASDGGSIYNTFRLSNCVVDVRPSWSIAWVSSDCGPNPQATPWPISTVLCPGVINPPVEVPTPSIPPASTSLAQTVSAEWPLSGQADDSSSFCVSSTVAPSAAPGDSSVIGRSLSFLAPLLTGNTSLTGGGPQVPGSPLLPSRVSNGSDLWPELRAGEAQQAGELSAGQIAGGVVGSLTAALGIVAGLVFLLILRRKRKEEPSCPKDRAPGAYNSEEFSEQLTQLNGNFDEDLDEVFPLPGVAENRE
jgi:hypothetical protein